MDTENETQQKCNPIDIINKNMEFSDDVEPMIQALETIMDLNDNLEDEINSEYIRGQIEFFANFHPLKTDYSVVVDTLHEIVENISGRKLF